ncbi:MULTISPECIES: macrolide family glycosyltransferase [unclassified Streptomyces]|uniref:macrolide family glycosyltransferase n=1 Tax=unclassified Streptomyces TaxID=2593676 RepID=UPI00278C2C49|nr:MULTISPECIES: macrolide family glycosyltransferase [unclassified Streptomyces]
MTTTTLLIAGMPAAGHVNPTLPVVTELVRSGVDVVYLCDAEFADRVRDTGARFVPYPEGVLTARDIAAATRAGSSVGVVAKVLRACSALVPFVVEQARALGPAALMHDSNALWGRLAATAVNLPTISFMTTFLVGTGAVKALTVRENLAVVGPTLRDMPDALRARRALVKEFGAGAVPDTPMLPLRGDLTLFPIPEELQAPDPRLDATCRFTGPTTTTPDTDAGPTPLDPELAAHLSGGDPVVLVSLGTLHDGGAAFFRDCGAALGDLPVRVLLATGHGVDPADLGTVPPNTLARRSVPQLAVLRQASVFVTHGGMNSALEGIGRGVPLVVVPQQVEQLLIGRAIAERGAALVLRQHLTHRPVPPADLRAAVERVLGDRGMAKAAEEMGRRFRAEGGAVRAAELVREMLDEHAG